MNKTKSKSLVLALLIACSVETTTSSIEPISNTTIEPISNTTTTTELNMDLALQNFQLAWEKNLKEPITLSINEKQLTANLFYYWKWKGDKWTPENQNFYELKVNGVSCYRIWSGMGSAWLDEVHPVQDNYPNRNETMKAGVYGVPVRPIGYWAVERYMCEEDSIYGTVSSLFGAPFYYQDTWWIYQGWIYQELRDWDIVDCKSPCSYGNSALATRVAIDLDDEIYSAYIPNPTEVEIEKYDKGWEEQLETFPVLTKEEFDKSFEFYLTYRLGRGNYPFAELKITVDNENYICDRKSRGMVIPAFANEQHPIYLYLLEAGDNEEVDESIIDEVSEYPIDEYFHTLSYNCGVGDPYDSEDRLGLYGPLFFQDNQWWGFEIYEDDYWEKSGKRRLHAFMKYFVKRVSLGSTLYDE